MKDTCAGTDVDTRECRGAKLCPAEAKGRSECLKTESKYEVMKLHFEIKCE